MSAPTSRPRALPLGNEEASAQLILGDFEKVHTLSLSAARLLINAITRKEHSVNPHFKESVVLVKTQDWLDTFAKFQVESSVTQLEQMLTATPGLEGFERSQLGEFPCLLSCEWFELGGVGWD